MGKNFTVGNCIRFLFYRDPPPPQYQSGHLTPCRGLEVQKRTHALMTFKGPSNTFDLNPKWARTLLLAILYGIFIEHPTPPIKVDI
jgi:hypothetical protein